MTRFAERSWLAVTLLTLSVGSLRLATGSVNSIPIDLAPLAAVGSLTSIQNFVGNIGGLLAPIVTGHIVNVTGSFVVALVVAGGMALFGAISYLFIMGDVEKDPISSFAGRSNRRTSCSAAGAARVMAQTKSQNPKKQSLTTVSSRSSRALSHFHQYGSRFRWASHFT